MPTLFQSDAAKGIDGTPYAANNGDVQCKRTAVALPNTLAANDVIEMITIPPGMRPVDMVLDSDDLDSNGSPTITFDVGWMSGTPGDNDSSRTVAAEFFSGNTVAQAGGSARPTLATAFRQAVSSAARSIGIKVANVAATKAAGTVGLTVYFVTDN